MIFKLSFVNLKSGKLAILYTFLLRKYTFSPFCTFFKTQEKRSGLTADD